MFCYAIFHIVAWFCDSIRSCSRYHTCSAAQGLTTYDLKGTQNTHNTYTKHYIPHNKISTKQGVQNNSGDTKNNQPETTIKKMVHKHKIKRAGNHTKSPNKTPLYTQNKTIYKQVYRKPRKHPSKKKSPPSQKPDFQSPKTNSQNRKNYPF